MVSHYVFCVGLFVNILQSVLMWHHRNSYGQHVCLSKNVNGMGSMRGRDRGCLN